MSPDEIVSGRSRAWSLLEKLGEGDAGEVFLVQSLMEEGRAILKRPHRGAFSSEKLRQAAQIEREGQALRALAYLGELPSCVRTPQFLDQSKANVEESDRFFIIITPATGFDLRTLARCRRLREPQTGPGIPPDPSQSAFLHRFSQLDAFPRLPLLRLLEGLIPFLEGIHSFEFSGDEGRHHGLIWNDVKVEHCYWDPGQGCFTLIDWGNADFLDEKGVTRDRARSRLDDYYQLLEDIGAFMASEAPELHAQLGWPQHIDLTEVYSSGIQPLKVKLGAGLESELATLNVARMEEERLLNIASPGYADFEKS